MGCLGGKIVMRIAKKQQIGALNVRFVGHARLRNNRMARSCRHITGFPSATLFSQQ
jgi:hypothetical protein